jgi:putative ABC transport system substrate-binding protein
VKIGAISTALLIAIFVTPANAAAAGHVPRIGYLVVSPLVDPPSAERTAFFEGLRELGYVEGKNLIVEYRSAEGDPEILPFLAEELAELKVDLIVCLGAVPALAAKKATRTIPIVMTFATDPVGNGLITSLARPGGNITGMSSVNPELGAKRLELLKEAVPGIKKVAVLWDSKNPAVLTEWQAIQAAARALGIRLHPIDIGNRGIGEALDTIRKNPPDALLAIIDLRMSAYRIIISEFALRHRLPTMFGQRDFALAGGLLSYAPSFSALTHRAASYVDKILKGANPADLPIQQPTHFELIVNLRTAKTLGLKVPPSILVRADEVIR